MLQKTPEGLCSGGVIRKNPARAYFPGQSYFWGNAVEVTAPPLFVKILGYFQNPHHAVSLLGAQSSGMRSRRASPVGCGEGALVWLGRAGQTVGPGMLSGRTVGSTSLASPLACVLGPSRSQGGVCMCSDPYVVKLSLFEMTVVVRVFQI